jgi:GH35 family endo-1,4-beta-xylanase
MINLTLKFHTGVWHRKLAKRFKTRIDGKSRPASKLRIRIYGIVFKHWRRSHWWDKKFTGNATLIVDYRLDATDAEDARRFQNLNFESEKRTNECLHYNVSN